MLIVSKSSLNAQIGAAAYRPAQIGFASARLHSSTV
jgi:hypothetical protein